MPLDADIDRIPKQNWSEVKSCHRNGGPSGHVNRHRALKGFGKGSLIAGKLGVGAVDAASTALGMKTSVVAVAGAVAAGTAVSATGIGLAATAGALALGQIAISANSLHKTIAHIKGLTEIQRDIGRYTECLPKGNSDHAKQYHQFIAEYVLPYIIHQKKHKAVKKGVNLVPFAGIVATGLYEGGRKLGEFAEVTDGGKKRSFYVNVLGEHLITCDCSLTVQIVAELMGSNWDTSQLMLMDLSAVTKILEPKMQSM